MLVINLVITFIPTFFEFHIFNRPQYTSWWLKLGWCPLLVRPIHYVITSKVPHCHVIAHSIFYRQPFKPPDSPKLDIAQIPNICVWNAWNVVEGASSCMHWYRHWRAVSNGAHVQEILTALQINIAPLYLRARGRTLLIEGRSTALLFYKTANSKAVLVLLYEHCSQRVYYTEIHGQANKV